MSVCVVILQEGEEEEEEGDEEDAWALRRIFSVNLFQNCTELAMCIYVKQLTTPWEASHCNKQSIVFTSSAIFG